MDVILYRAEDGREYRAVIYETDEFSRLMCAAVTMPEEQARDSFSMGFLTRFSDLGTERNENIKDLFVGLMKAFSTNRRKSISILSALRRVRCKATWNSMCRRIR
jgi:hypothetical protein